jgi:predicted nucleic acid-binding protein
MDVLIDTNIFIYREDDGIVPESLQRLERSLREDEHNILVHPLSAKEIRNDPDEVRREKAMSRLETYRELSYPKYPVSESRFRNEVPEESGNDRVDNMLLYSVFNEDVDFLITEDLGIHKKAAKLGIRDRVFSIEEGEEYFSPDYTLPLGPDSIIPTTLGELNLNDEIFDSLKREYSQFTEWAKAHSERKTWINRCEDGTLGAILVIKPNEVEEIGEYPPIKRSKRLKISTMKVGKSRQGSKMGELLISIAVREAINHSINEVYLTHYINEDGQDHLVRLIEQYGFKQVSEEDDGEAIFLKHLTPPPEGEPDPTDLAATFYPSYYDGPQVTKFLIPIQPPFHEKLFPSYQKRKDLVGQLEGEVSSEGNAIKKAYLTHSNSRRVKEGGVLLFYRSHDEKEITSLGICESVHYRLSNADEINRVVGKRSVFSDSEIEDYAKKETTVILFSWHFDLPSPVNYSDLLKERILTGPLRTVTEISHQDYKAIKERGNLDERFARD